MRTIDGAFRESVRLYPELTALRFRRDDMWEELTYSEMNTEVTEIMAGLVNIGVGKDAKVAIMSENRPEWIMSYLAIIGLGAVAVPIDAQLGEDESGYIINHSGAQTVICSAGCNSTISHMLVNLDHIENIVILDRDGDSAVKDAECGDRGTKTSVSVQESRKRFLSYDRLKKDGASELERVKTFAFDESVDRLASIIYTSGTTGMAKGVMLTHKNFMANVDSIKKTISITTEDGLLLLLPLHHSFPFTTCMVWPLAMGATIDIVDIMSRDRTRLIMECRPTIMVGVPLLYAKIYRGIMRQVESSTLKNALFKYGGKKIIGKALKKKLGGRLRYMISGAAPMDSSIIEGIRNLGIEFLEGYGLTETSPVVSVNNPGAVKIGSVGLPLPGVQTKIIDPGEDGIGEIAISGDNVMSGYYNDPEQTKAVLNDGWFRSGDIGMIDGDGYIFITGRAKDVIVTPGGKNVYPEVVESQINKSACIAESVVIGYKASASSGENVGVLITPDYENLIDYTRKQNIALSKDIDPARLTEEDKDEIIAACRSLLESEVKHAMKKLAPFQHVTRIGIEREEFLKTSTRKIKRYLYKGRLDIIET